MKTRADKRGRFVLRATRCGSPTALSPIRLVVSPGTRRGRRAARITRFIIEGMKGFSTAQKLDKLGMRGSDTCELVFEDSKCRRENVLSEVGAAASTSDECLDYERAVLVAGPHRHHAGLHGRGAALRA